MKDICRYNKNTFTKIFSAIKTQKIFYKLDIPYKGGQRLLQSSTVRTIMTGQRIGYIRVSTFDQNPERQLEQVDVDRIFSDTALGKDVHRPQLEALIDFIREGDTYTNLLLYLST